MSDAHLLALCAITILVITFGLWRRHHPHTSLGFIAEGLLKKAGTAAACAAWAMGWLLWRAIPWVILLVGALFVLHLVKMTGFTLL